MAGTSPAMTKSEALLRTGSSWFFRRCEIIVQALTRLSP
jgi:hypothetical protein